MKHEEGFAKKNRGSENEVKFKFGIIQVKLKFSPFALLTP